MNSTSQPATDHAFGGVSTDLKLALVEGYLKAFNIALKRHGFERIYIDAFAGTGERTVTIEATEANLIEDASEARTDRLRGSARIALEVDPPFDRLIFVDQNPRHCAALRALIAEFPGREASVIEGDANGVISRIARETNWGNRRAVLFLDPYGMAVDWTTLEAIRATKAIDVWYLVSLAGLFRQAPLSASQLTPDKRAAITRMLGTSEWEKEWYAPRTANTLLDFMDEEPVGGTRAPGTDLIEQYVLRRLRTLFPEVLEPLRLRNAQNVPMFSLFFAISNPSKAAIKVATNIASHMLRTGKSSQVRP